MLNLKIYRYFSSLIIFKYNLSFGHIMNENGIFMDQSHNGFFVFSQR